LEGEGKDDHQVNCCLYRVFYGVFLVEDQQGQEIEEGAMKQLSRQDLVCCSFQPFHRLACGVGKESKSFTFST